MSRATYYHREMHRGIWEWISGIGRLDSSHRRNELLREGLSAEDGVLNILTELINSLPSEDHYYRIFGTRFVTVETPPGVAAWEEWHRLCSSYRAYDFTGRVCTIGSEILENTSDPSSGQQQLLCWVELQNILMYYQDDVEGYLNYLDGLFIQRGLDLAQSDGVLVNDIKVWSDIALEITDDMSLSPECSCESCIRKLKNQLVLYRYLDSHKIYDWERDRENWTEFSDNPSIQRMHNSVYWSSRIQGATTLRSEQSEREKEESESQISLKKIQEVVDNEKGNLREGVYLSIMNLLKEEWNEVSNDQ